MDRARSAFGIFEIFSYIAPGAVVLLSIYLLYWPNPSAELIEKHLTFLGQFSILTILFITSYIIGFIFYFVGSFTFFQIIQKLLGKSPEKIFQKRHFYPENSSDSEHDDPQNYTYGLRLKQLLENNYGTGLSVWLCYKQCESAVRAKHPQNAEVADRFNAFAIMSRNMSLAFLLLAIVLIFNVSSGKNVLSLEYIVLNIFILASSIIFMWRTFHFSYWAIREIFNTYYFMNYLDSGRTDKRKLGSEQQAMA